MRENPKEPPQGRREWEIFDIILKDGKRLRHYPDRGSNYSSMESLKKYLTKNDKYEFTSGNSRRRTLHRDDIESMETYKTVPMKPNQFRIEYYR